MPTPQELLRTMIGEIPESVENIDKSLAQLDAVDKQLDDQISAIEDGVCEQIKSDFSQYMTLEKLPHIQETVNPTAFLVYDANFGSIGYGNTLEGWSVNAMVEQPQPPPPDPPVPPVEEVIYSTTVNWDNDAYITEWMNDWSAANDFLTRPLSSGATYGLIPYKQNVASASSILTENKAKLESSKTTFEKYSI